MIHPDKYSHPDATLFTQMVNDASEQLNKSNLGRGRKNHSKRYGLK